ncbi:hypothetical protein MNBD_GAMMA26-1841 [hydrothermal vent metagenome]|uniref:Chaperone protein DnaJ n=1 Tax=hydrothermal vent metagenome TaxID=652676 RepID=A0A3B1B4F3_9ZZZZ
MNHKQSVRLERFSENCSTCGGYGTITRYYGGGAFISEIDCNQCNSRGEVGNCVKCKGTGVLQGEDNASVTDVKCLTCLGVGAIGDCPDCAGTGVELSSSDGDNVSEDEVECVKCNGFGCLDLAQC